MSAEIDALKARLLPKAAQPAANDDSAKAGTSVQPAA